MSPMRWPKWWTPRQKRNSEAPGKNVLRSFDGLGGTRCRACGRRFPLPMSVIIRGQVAGVANSDPARGTKQTATRHLAHVRPSIELEASTNGAMPV